VWPTPPTCGNNDDHLPAASANNRRKQQPTSAISRNGISGGVAGVTFNISAGNNIAFAFAPAINGVTTLMVMWRRLWQCGWRSRGNGVCGSRMP